VVSIATHSGTQTTQPPLDAALARLAARQHGVVSLVQLLGLGLSASAVRNRVRRGRLHRVHRGVYTVGHSLLSREGRYMAAVLACGPGAVLSHRSAAELLGLRRTERSRVDVTARVRRRRPGIDAHKSAGLAAEDITSVLGVPCTTTSRTLLDLAEVLDERGLQRAIERAEHLRLFDLRSLERALARADGRVRAGRLRSVLGRGFRRSTLTRNDLEERFLLLCRAAGAPEPEVNAWIPLGDGDGAEADFLWRGRRLAIETDGNETHGTRQAFEADRLRDQRLAIAGFQVIRFTWRQVEDDPDAVVATLRELVV
jgi:Transcriptional regulator, AbiEi antitoxin/Protein of unknown function (DUF559)